MSAIRPPLIPLQAFVVVAARASVRAAARELVIGHSVVSRHLRTLQDFYGCRLVITNTRGVSLTEQGQRLYEAVAPAFAMIQQANEMLRPRPAARRLEIWCIPGLASRWLAPRLDDLQALLPTYQIDLRPTDQNPDFARDEADLAIGYGDRLAPCASDVDVEELYRPRVFPVTSPGWLAHNPRPRSIDALLHTPMIHERSEEQWRSWLAQAGVNCPAPLGGARLWSAHLALDAAEHGQGVAIANELLAAESIASGRLQALFDPGVRLGSYLITCRRRRRDDPMIVKIRTWLLREMHQAASTAADGAALGRDDPSGRPGVKPIAAP